MEEIRPFLSNFDPEISDNSNSSSDCDLQIIVDTPKNTKKSKISNKTHLNSPEKEFIKEIEGRLDKILDEKSSKINLTTVNVKNILKEVIKNEDMLKLVKRIENPEKASETLTFEPKLTRSKAKELFPINGLSSLPWPASSSTSPEVHVLINNELPEDSSDDEYVPGDDDSEDDRDSSLVSESPRCVTPPTPSKSDCGTQTNWTEDGMFKIPPSKNGSEEEDANIALRTRSKLCLSETPLEEIERAFVPPDITTDMYDMDCDDDDWGNFLKMFMRPLDEVTKAPEDEDHDPEYNVLADEIDRIDQEDFRSDRGVKVTKRELNELISELAEYANSFAEEETENVNVDNENEPQYKIIENVTNVVNKTAETSDINKQNKIMINSEEKETSTTETMEKTSVTNEIYTDLCHVQQTQMNDPLGPAEVQYVVLGSNFEENQLHLLHQQMRQHVQMLTSNFLLTYQNPEHYKMAQTFRENLLNLKLLSQENPYSAFNACNLKGALELTSNWIEKFEGNCPEAKEVIRHFTRTLEEAKIARFKSHHRYVPEIPPLIMETVVRSEVFIYPSLLPKIAFKPRFSERKQEYTLDENELIAKGLEQFIEFAKNDPNHSHKNGEAKMHHVCHYIMRYMMPMKPSSGIFMHIQRCRKKDAENNPIKTYFEYGQAPTTYHYVSNLEHFKVLPPCQREKDSLPYLWKCYLHPEEKLIEESNRNPPSLPSKEPKRKKTPVFINFAAKSTPKVRIPPLPKVVPFKCLKSPRFIKEEFSDGIKPVSYSTPINSRIPPTNKENINTIKIAPSVLKLKFNSSIFQNTKQQSTNMLPHMPSLNTPVKRPLDENVEININSSVTDNHVNITVNEMTNEVISSDQTSTQQPSKKTKLSVVTPLVSKIHPDEKSSKLNEKKKSSESDGMSSQEEDCVTAEEENVEKDNADDINALMVASSTIKTVGRKEPSGAEKKKAKLRREHNATLAMLQPENATVTHERAKSYAEAYINKVRLTLDPQEFLQFMDTLNNFDDKYGKVCDLYRKVEGVLYPKYKDLLDEFLAFLTPAQARDVGRLLPHMMLSNMSLFLCKLEAYFKQQPSQLKKIYKSLNELAASVNVTIDRVKSTILPLLRGNNLLTDWFLQLFPTEKPPDSLLKGPFETIDLNDDFRQGDEIFESITLPDTEDPYGGPKCICKCHDSSDNLYKSRSRHCIPCGTKFLQGRIYIQTGKGLRLANVTFDGKSGPEHNIRLYVGTNERQKKRSDSSPSKQISPSKETHDENRTHVDSEDDTDSSKKKNQRISCRSPRKKKTTKSIESEKPIKVFEKVNNSSEKEKLCKVSGSSKNGGGCKVSKPKSAVTSTNALSVEVEKNTPMTENCTSTMDVPSTSANIPISDKKMILNDESQDWDSKEMESSEIKLSSEHSTESESDVPEESSQDNTNSDSNESTEETESVTASPIQSDSNTNDEITWTLDEDKIILETLQKELNKEKAFDKIKQALENRSIAQITQRFHTLMELLQEMTKTK